MPSTPSLTEWFLLHPWDSFRSAKAVKYMRGRGRSVVRRGRSIASRSELTDVLIARGLTR
jgi:hypothetical protein